MGRENGKNLISLYSTVYSERAMAHRVGQEDGRRLENWNTDKR